MAESHKVCSRCSERKPSSEFTPRIRGIPESGYCRSCIRPVKHPHWQCPGCGEIIYHLGAGHHAHGCPSGLRKGAESPSEPRSGSSGVTWLAAQALILRVASHGVVDNFAVDDRVVITERARRQLLRLRETRRIIIVGGNRHPKQRTRHLVRSFCQAALGFCANCGAFAPWKPSLC